jgi:tetratricopeptide (TPR) repeat protein
MKSTIIFGVLLTAFVCGTTDEQGTDFKALYEAHQWFQLRAAVKSTQAPAFYRGAVACVFNDLSDAEPELDNVIASAPQSEEAFESHALLANAYIRAGRYRQALAQIEKMLAIKSDDAGTKNALPLFAALGRYTDQAVTQLHSSTMRYRMKDGNLFLPIAVNERPASYIVDNRRQLLRSECGRSSPPWSGVGLETISGPVFLM